MRIDTKTYFLYFLLSIPLIFLFWIFTMKVYVDFGLLLNVLFILVVFVALGKKILEAI